MTMELDIVEIGIAFKRCSCAAYTHTYSAELHHNANLPSPDWRLLLFSSKTASYLRGISASLAFELFTRRDSISSSMSYTLIFLPYKSF